MKTSLTQFLACVVCDGELTMQIVRVASDLPWQEVVEGYLTCQQCNKRYPISDGIPRLLPDGPIPSAVKNTVDGFGYEWQRFNNHIKNKYMSNRQNFYDFIFPVTENFFRGKIILDAGCGMGRFLKLGAEFGSKQIIGMDLSTAVEAAYLNTRHIANAHVVQGDILAPPFKSLFDYIFSIGALQFLSNPQKGFHELTKLLIRGGRISIWVYSKENNEGLIRILSPLRKHITSRISKPWLYLISHIVGVFYYSLLRLIYKPANEVDWLKKIGSKLPMNEYLYFNSQLSYRELVSIIFDHLVPQLVVYLSKDEILEWFEMEQLTSIEISSRNNMSWRAHGTA